MRMAQQVTTKIPKVDYEKIRQLVNVGFYINISDFVREAIRAKLAELELSSKLDPPETMKARVYEYFKERGGVAWPDEAAKELGYSVIDVLNALQMLKDEGKTEEVDATKIVEKA